MATKLTTYKFDGSNTPRIVGVSSGSGDAGFKVEFPNGFEGEPDIQIHGLMIIGDGKNTAAVCALVAAANYLIQEATKIQQGSSELEIYLTGNNGDVKNDV